METFAALKQPVQAILPRLACPACQAGLEYHNGKLHCCGCAQAYAVIDGIPDLRLKVVRGTTELEDWTEHWSGDKQNSFSQKFFSHYRKIVFARAIAYFAQHYFPSNGLFLEAGAGTSETSIRIDKHQGRRTLVALDIILPVLQQSHPVMDIRLCGDIFHLPFQDNSVDGIWNVGVMEHFTHEQINAILEEFHRVLRPGAALILFWPGTRSVPQKILRTIEKVVNSDGRANALRFHPPEISQLESVEVGRRLLHQNGFELAAADSGPRTLLAFITLVGKKIQER